MRSAEYHREYAIQARADAAKAPDASWKAIWEQIARDHEELVETLERARLRRA